MVWCGCMKVGQRTRWGGARQATVYADAKRGTKTVVWKTVEDSRKTAGRQDREAGGDVPDVLLRLLRCLTVIYMCVCVRGAKGEGARHIGDAGGRGESAEVKCEQADVHKVVSCPAPPSSSRNRVSNLDESTAMEVHGRFDAPVSYGNSDCEPMSFG